MIVVLRSVFFSLFLGVAGVLLAAQSIDIYLSSSLFFIALLPTLYLFFMAEIARIPIVLFAMIGASITRIILYFTRVPVSDSFFIIFCSIVLFAGVVRTYLVWRSETQERIISVDNHIKEIDSRLKKKDPIDIIELIDLHLQLAGSAQEKMMSRAKPRADFLYGLGIFLIVLSLGCPVAATWFYYTIQPFTEDGFREVIRLKKELGEVPKELNLAVGRDWHILLGGITFGFLWLAAGGAVLAQQSNEMKTYFKMGQKISYLERLNSIVHITLRKDDKLTDNEKDAVNLVSRYLLMDIPTNNDEGDEKTGSEEGRSNSVEKLASLIANHIGKS